MTSISPELAVPKQRTFRLPRMQEAGLVVVIVLIGLLLTFWGGDVTVGGRTANNFLRIENLLGNVATPMATYAIMAVGVTFVIISGGIDISVGAIYALAGLGVAAVLQNFAVEAPWWQTVPTAVAVGCGIGLLCGVLNGGMVVGLRMHPFIVTLGTMSIFRGLANVLVTEKTLPSQGRDLPESFSYNFVMWSLPTDWVNVPNVQPVPLLAALLVLAGGWFYLSAMVAGRENYAVGGNEEAARFSGIRVNLVKMRVYALSGMLAGLAGTVSAGFFGTVSTNSGQGYELTVIAAAVVGGASLTGGRGTALGAVLGALIIRMIEDGILVLKLDQQYSSIIIGIAIILAVAVDRLSEYWRNKRLAGARRM